MWKRDNSPPNSVFDGCGKLGKIIVREVLKRRAPLLYEDCVHKPLVHLSQCDATTLVSAFCMESVCKLLSPWSLRWECWLPRKYWDSSSWWMKVSEIITNGSATVGYSHLPYWLQDTDSLSSLSCLCSNCVPPCHERHWYSFSFSFSFSFIA